MYDSKWMNSKFFYYFLKKVRETAKRQKIESLLSVLNRGDYEHQIHILEFLIRYQAREDQETVRKWFGENLGLKFCQISKKTFESDARPFLNALNQNNTIHRFRARRRSKIQASFCTKKGSVNRSRT